MSTKKTLDELTLMDDYMFAKVMQDAKNLKPLLERILEIEIAKIEVIETQKEEKEGYGSKGVRLDVYATDDNGYIYNVEVQTSNKYNLPKRMRYYHSTQDLKFLTPGEEYVKLPKSFVIFICNYDEFRLGRYIYSFETRCKEEPNLIFGDESYKIVINTRGTRGEISEELKEVLDYLNTGHATGKYTKALDDAVNAVKADENMRSEYMRLEENYREKWQEGWDAGLKEGRESGLKEGRESGLKEGRDAGLKEGRESGLKEGFLRTLITLVDNGTIDISVAAKEAGLSEEQFLAKRDELKVSKGDVNGDGSV